MTLEYGPLTGKEERFYRFRCARCGRRVSVVPGDEKTKIYCEDCGEYMRITDHFGHSLRG